MKEFASITHYPTAKELWDEMSEDFSLLYAGTGIEDAENNVTGKDNLSEWNFRGGFVAGWFIAREIWNPCYVRVGRGLVLKSEDSW